MAQQQQQNAQLGLELKARWCAKLLAGEKQVELRRYQLPAGFQDVPALLLSTPDGNEGVSTLPADLMPAGYPGAVVAGTVVFTGQTRYTSYQQWAADEHKHCVAPGTPYSWQPGSTTELWGWHVARVEAAQPPRPVPRMRRVVSSWFRVEEEEEEEEEGPAAEADGGGGSSRGESDA